MTEWATERLTSRSTPAGPDGHGSAPAQAPHASKVLGGWAAEAASARGMDERSWNRLKTCSKREFRGPHLLREGSQPGSRMDAGISGGGQPLVNPPGSHRAAPRLRHRPTRWATRPRARGGRGSGSRSGRIFAVAWLVDRARHEGVVRARRVVAERAA